MILLLSLKLQNHAVSVMMVEPRQLESKLLAVFLPICSLLLNVLSCNAMASRQQGCPSSCELRRTMILFCYKTCDVLWGSQQINNAFCSNNLCNKEEYIAHCDLIYQGIWDWHAFSHSDVDSGLIKLEVETTHSRSDNQHSLWHMFLFLPTAVPFSFSRIEYSPSCFKWRSNYLCLWCCLTW